MIASTIAIGITASGVQRDGYATDVFFNAAMDFIHNTEDPFFVYLATYMPHSPHTLPNRAWAEKYGPEVSSRLAYFFAGIERIDRNVGRLRKALKESGNAENTLFIFMTDNGGTAGVNLFNAGMRGHKGQVYEGGHRVPLFVHWPRGRLRHGADVNDLTAHIDVLPTLIDLCGLTPSREVDFDGRSFKQQLFTPELDLPERILFVEKQRTLQRQEWENTAGMTRRWRLVNNTELYDITEDPGQSENVIAEHPEVARTIRRAFPAYWQRVSPGDRDVPRFIVGHPSDPETFLSASDWHVPGVPWNHAMVAAGSSCIGSWHINIAQDGVYRFAVRRWPREAEAPIQGVPVFRKKVDAWDIRGGKDSLIYGHKKSKMTPLPVHEIQLQVGAFSNVKPVAAEDQKIVFDVPLKQGDTEVKGTMLDQAGKTIGGAYYIYVSRLDTTE